MKKNYSDTGVGIFAYNRPSHLKDYLYHYLIMI